MFYVSSLLIKLYPVLKVLSDHPFNNLEPPNCRCDNLCKTYNTCCSEFDELCLKTVGDFEYSKDRCGETRNEQHACHCSEDCDVPCLQEECKERLRVSSWVRDNCDFSDKHH
uniref:SMB domain-containing protein n=1 Tax=Cyprinus carpio TaxID=7962 RepID=A0A8C2F2X0_CYPCA